RDGLWLRDVYESLVLDVAIEGKLFLVDVGDKQILPAVIVVVRRIHAHSRARLAVFAEAHFGGHGDFFPAIRAAIHEEKILSGVVGDKEVHAPIVVDIRCYDPKSFAKSFADQGVMADFGECAIAIVAEEGARRGMKCARDTVVSLTGFVPSA